jgi:hypothetical protein
VPSLVGVVGSWGSRSIGTPRPRNVLSPRDALVDSERPLPPTHERPITRPFYLVAAMVLLWILGVETLLQAGSTAVRLREGGLDDVAMVARSGAGDPQSVIVQVLVAARLSVLGAMPHLAFPLSVAKALLAGVLVMASTLVLVGRPSSRGFALQALGANAAFAILEYVLLRHARGQWIEVAARAAAVIQDPALPASPVEYTRFIGFMIERGRLVLFELGIPFLAAVALTRPKTKTYFAEVAAAAASAEEEEQ